MIVNSDGSIAFTVKKPDIENDFISCFDIDGTLIRVPNETDKVDDIITITDPYTGTVKTRVIHTPNVELMRSYNSRGYYIIAWSHGGRKWARAVVDKLGLTDIVGHCQAKPNKMVDDLSVEKGIGHTIFVKED